MSVDDVKATTLKEIKLKLKLKYNTIYGDEHKNSNMNCRTSPITMPILGRVILNTL